jgi:outer membrane lipoprotein-sorting protein
MKSKQKCQRLHVKNRIRERYNLNISLGQIEKIEQDIRSGNTFLIRKESEGRSIHRVVVFDKTVVVVYNKKLGNVVTALTKRDTDG